MHPTGQNPTLTMRRDLTLVEHLEALGFDEFWVGPTAQDANARALSGP